MDNAELHKNAIIPIQKELFIVNINAIKNIKKDKEKIRAEFPNISVSTSIFSEGICFRI